MLFMLNIEVSIPAEMPQADKDALRQREDERAMQLVKAQKLRRIWRIVGQTANFSVWQAASLEELHEAVQSLPMFPYMKVTVVPLIQHPVTTAWTSKNGAMPAF